MDGQRYGGIHFDFDGAGPPHLSAGALESLETEGAADVTTMAGWLQSA